MVKRNLQEQGTHPGDEGAEGPSGWQEALLYVRENPTKVAGGIGFLLLCIVIGGLFNLKNIAENRKDNTRYAAALLQIEDPDLRTAELEKIANESTRWSVEALYKLGETAIEAKTYDKAREAFEKLLAEHGDSEYAPMAADGLAFLDENAGKLEEALQGYINVFEKWDDTLTGRREPYNIGRVLEELGKPAEAIEHYQKQVEIFPGSSVARKSQAALAKLKAKNPELFPEEEKPEEDMAEVSEKESVEPEATEEMTEAPVEAAEPKQDTPVAEPATETPEEVAAEKAPAAEPTEEPAPAPETSSEEAVTN